MEETKEISSQEFIISEKEAIREIAKILSELEQGKIILDNFALGRLYEMLNANKKIVN